MAELRRGDTGPGVRRWQVFLKRLQYRLGDADGLFGPATEAATKQFQQDHAITAQPGVVGGRTQATARRVRLRIAFHACWFGTPIKREAPVGEPESAGPRGRPSWFALGPDHVNLESEAFLTQAEEDTQQPPDEDEYDHFQQ